MLYLKWIYFIPPVLFAGVAHVDRLWVFANVAVGFCSIPNLIAILALSSAFFLLKKDYLDNKNEFTTKMSDLEKKYIRI